MRRPHVCCSRGDCAQNSARCINYADYRNPTKSEQILVADAACESEFAHERLIVLDAGELVKVGLVGDASVEGEDIDAHAREGGAECADRRRRQEVVGDERAQLFTRFIFMFATNLGEVVVHVLTDVDGDDEIEAATYGAAI